MVELKFEDKICILCGVFVFGLVLEVLSLLFDVTVWVFAIGNFMIFVSVIFIIKEIVSMVRKYEDKYGKMDL